MSLPNMNAANLTSPRPPEPVKPAAPQEASSFPKPGPAGDEVISPALLDRLTRPIHELEKRIEAFHAERGKYATRRQELLDSGEPEGSPALAKLDQEHMSTLFAMQIEIQNLGLRVQIAAKLLEHGSSGIRTVLQTPI